MKAITIIFPHQLFKKHPAVKKGRTVWLMEESRFFIDFRYHKKKLMLHRASMRYYRDYLRKKGYAVRYFDYMDVNGEQILINLFRKEGISEVHLGEVYDVAVEKLYTRVFHKAKIKTVWYETPMFLTDSQARLLYVESHTTFKHTDFYMWQRKRLDILMQGSKPRGGKWSFDTDNRKKLPKSISIPKKYTPPENAYVAEARKYVQEYFAENYGSHKDFDYPVTHKYAEKVLDDFLQNRLKKFGTYQDALSKEHDVLFHSMLTPALNIGLLEPQMVVEKTLAYAQKNRVPLNSLEGFIRQIIGWREFMYVVYEHQGDVLRRANVFDHHRMIPRSWYQGKTGIDPIDDTIRNVLRTGYAHHIERLMVVGNMMLLSEFDPDHVYQWFMELFIDAYDWVMVPNVYGMSQYAAGGLFATKPYISSSNYILNMSDYPQGEWCELWDALYWHFIAQHKKEFKKNPRMALMVKQYDKKSQKEKKYITTRAKTYFKNLGVSAYT